MQKQVSKGMCTYWVSALFLVHSPLTVLVLCISVSLLARGLFWFNSRCVCRHQKNCFLQEISRDQTLKKYSSATLVLQNNKVVLKTLPYGSKSLLHTFEVWKINFLWPVTKQYLQDTSCVVTAFKKPLPFFFGLIFAKHSSPYWVSFQTSELPVTCVFLLYFWCFNLVQILHISLESMVTFHFHVVKPDDFCFKIVLNTGPRTLWSDTALVELWKSNWRNLIDSLRLEPCCHKYPGNIKLLTDRVKSILKLILISCSSVFSGNMGHDLIPLILI